MASFQLSFSLRTSPNCKTVHLIGNWDGYKGQLPLSKDSSKAGSWKGTFRFQGTTLKPGQRYWYYYIMDGHFVSHDPAVAHTTEPTTGRKLNILDVPAGDKTKAAVAEKTSRRSSKVIAQGRPVSPSRIVSPKPVKPTSTVDKLTQQLATAQISDDESDSEIDDSDDESDVSDVPSLSSASSRSSRSSGCSSPSSDVSSSCSCNRYGITRKGERVKLDCGGSRCAAGSDSESCSDSEEEAEQLRERATRRQGVVVRNSRR